MNTYFNLKIGVDFALKVINWDSDTVIRLQLWDIAGIIYTKINLIRLLVLFLCTCRPRTLL
jgi:GTPase SAR1 family protein